MYDEISPKIEIINVTEEEIKEKLIIFLTRRFKVGRDEARSIQTKY